jgi:hypothetical protein
MPARTRVGVTRLPPPQHRPLITELRSTRWRDIVGWLGIVAGAAVFVAALAVPLDDPALLGASMLVFRSGRMLVDTVVVENPWHPGCTARSYGAEGR